MNAYTIIDAAMKGNITESERWQLDEIQAHDSYSEPGYDTDKPIILTGNYNPSDFDAPGDFGRAVDLLERVAELEWSDEWATCEECGGLVRTSGDCWGWTPYYHLFSGCELVCFDCIDPKEYLDDIANDPTKACLPGIDPVDHGWELHQGGFENGWYPGQNDDPESIAKNIPDNLDYVFGIDGTGQFDIEFSIYVRSNL